MDNTSIITQVTNPKEEEILSSTQEKVSLSNSSLKKQRSRSIFSSLFCCFRSYNVEPPATNNNTSALPPPVEENGAPPKCAQVEVISIPSPPAKYLLPEVNINDYDKKCVVIDLDETLVHSSFKASRCCCCCSSGGCGGSRMTHFHQILLLSVRGPIQDDWAVRTHLPLQRQERAGQQWIGHSLGGSTYLSFVREREGVGERERVGNKRFFLKDQVTADCSCFSVAD
ncbi:CTD (carboxy-terminal domain, RNA polymerase II, polypeptide A) small phosphatase-like b isoform X3 [Alosa sapidissima]|uniref:CTD (carboxy-terminal domain, RNA polymerase II, polypeptide A) small phosphatase-like b isoform X3 n=1 Tax=Alosa sapidissima TaxID=34773 RepID=UPI001C08B306|nr:CTD (carboxy-terminal domain, RNA polymerase II, polypeptide A) small phosphatase-like b isoform X3 [Alosa sapidissima]